MRSIRPEISDPLPLQIESENWRCDRMKRYFVSFWSFILIVFLSAYSPAFGQDIKTPSGTAPVKTLSPISPVEMDNIVYILKEASISGTQLKIVLEATNKSSRRVIEFINEPGSTVIVDEFRNIYGNPGGTRVYMSCDGSDNSEPYRAKVEFHQMKN